MPTVATYYQLQDDLINLSTGSLTRTQNIPVTPAGGEGALVTWLAGNAGAPAGNVNYTVTLNGTKLGDYVMEAILPTIKIPMQEATLTGDVKKGNNVLVFTKTGGTGTLTLSAVMLWHRVNV
jgi:uncharacterized protein (DUF2147 family)